MLAIALGDPSGIGPEVALKALAAELPRDDERYLLIGDPALVHELNARLKLGLTFGAASDTTARVILGAPISKSARSSNNTQRADL